MKGVIFNLLEEVVCHEFGDGFWCDMLDMAGVQGSYTSLGNYPDAEFLNLIASASRLSGLSEREVLRWFGQRALPRLADRYSGMVKQFGSAKEFLLSVNSIIHPEVRKLYPGAVCPNFQFQIPDAASTILRYRSPRQLCALVEGFIEGAADHFKTKVSVAHTRCTHDGARDCELVVQWA